MIPVVSTVYLGYEASWPSIGQVLFAFLWNETESQSIHSQEKKKNEGKLAQDSATLLAWVANHNW